MSDRIPVSPEKLCVVVGVGEGLGAALARRFAADYKVALICLREFHGNRTRGA